MKDSLELAHTAPSRVSLLGERALLILVLATGIFFRVVHLATVPTGVLYDEAYNGIDVLRILAGERPLFLPANYGREALFQYLQAASVGLFGHTDWALRVPASACGIATLALSYLLVRRLYGPRVALLTCAWLAISLWHVMYSRIGLRTIALPVTLAAAFYCLWRGLDGLAADAGSELSASANLRPAVAAWCGLAGVMLGLSLYTYPTSRFAPFVVLGFAGFLAIFRRPFFRRALPAFVVTGLVTILVFAPEAWYFLRHPDDFVVRAREVSVLNPSLNQGDSRATLEYAALRTLGMFSFLGDEQPDRNLPGRPIFDPVSSLFLALGLARLLWEARHSPRAVFMILWVVILLLPSAISVRNVPNFLRVTGLIPAIFVLPALGAEWLWTLWVRWSPRLLQLVPVIGATLAFCSGTALTYRDYFQVWAHATAVSETFNADRWLAIDAAKGLARDGNTVYTGAGNADDPLQSYALAGEPIAGRVRLFDGTRSLIFPIDNTSATYVFAQRDLPPSATLQRYFGMEAARTLAVAPDGEPVRSYPLRAGSPTFSPDEPVVAQFDSVLQIIGFDFPRDVQAGGIVTVRWYWKTIGPTPRELAFFNQLYDLGEVRRGQTDDRAFAPDYWPPGTTGISTFDIKVAPTTPTGPATMLVGIYTRDDLGRLSVIDNLGRVAGGQLTLGPIKVHGQPSPAPMIANRQSARFADGIELVGYDLGPNPGKAGQPETLTLDWATRARPTADYTVFVHLVDQSGRLVGQADAPPVGGKYPTGVWDPGEVIADSHVIPLDPQLPAGVYRFEIGLYQPATGQRLPILDPNGAPAGDQVVVDNLEVR